MIAVLVLTAVAILVLVVVRWFLDFVSNLS
jgi:hypothetical protein